MGDSMPSSHLTNIYGLMQEPSPIVLFCGCGMPASRAEDLSDLLGGTGFSITFCTGFSTAYFARRNRSLLSYHTAWLARLPQSSGTPALRGLANVPGPIFPTIGE